MVYEEVYYLYAHQRVIKTSANMGVVMLEMLLFSRSSIWSLDEKCVCFLKLASDENDLSDYVNISRTILGSHCPRKLCFI